MITTCGIEEYKNWAICSQRKIEREGKEWYQITLKKEQDSNETAPQKSISQEEDLSQIVLSETSIEDYLWKRIYECPPIRQLYDEALKEQQGNETTAKHHIHLKLADPKTPFSHGHEAGAWSDFAEGEITVLLGQNANQLLSATVFEMTNFKQQKTFSHIDQQVKLGRISANKYAKESEKVEYNGMKIHHHVMQQAVSVYKWDEEIDEYASDLESWKTFEDYWKDRKDDDHANYYRAEFDLMNYKFSKLSSE